MERIRRTCTGRYMAGEYIPYYLRRVSKSSNRWLFRIYEPSTVPIHGFAGVFTDPWIVLIYYEEN